ncbi:MAG: hypothetical protein JXL80_08940 [Planctomycetes bacterium]|nr:hypothetical protein [Planctomycetota bacterium]
MDVPKTWVAIALAASVVCVSAAAASAQQPQDAKPAPLATTGWTATTLDEDHEAAKVAKHALESGKIFDAEFHMVETGRLTPEQLTAVKQRVSSFLVASRSMFPAVPRFAFADGVEFVLSETSSETISFLHGMADDPQKYPSTFGLLTRQKRQVYLVYVAKDNYGDLQMLHLLMWKTPDGWRAANFQLHAAKLSGLDAAKAFAAAETETTAGRHVLGLALYGAAGVMAPRTAYRLGGLQKRLQEPIATLSKQLGLPDRPIDTFQMGNTPVPLRGVNAASHKGWLYLLLWHDCPTAVAAADVPALQALMAVECLKRWPQTKDYFGGISLTTAAAGEDQRQKTINNNFAVAELEKAGDKTQDATAKDPAAKP